MERAENMVTIFDEARLPRRCIATVTVRAPVETPLFHCNARVLLSNGSISP
jgi:hypothetical protein